MIIPQDFVFVKRADNKMLKKTTLFRSKNMIFFLKYTDDVAIINCKTAGGEKRL